MIPCVCLSWPFSCITCFSSMLVALPQDGLTPLDLCLYSGRDIRTYELIKLLKDLPKAVWLLKQEFTMVIVDILMYCGFLTLRSPLNFNALHGTLNVWLSTSLLENTNVSAYPFSSYYVIILLGTSVWNVYRWNGVRLNGVLLSWCSNAGVNEENYLFFHLSQSEGAWALLIQLRRWMFGLCSRIWPPFFKLLKNGITSFTDKILWKCSCWFSNTDIPFILERSNVESAMAFRVYYRFFLVQHLNSYM